jgi:hypothetical protein
MTIGVECHIFLKSVQERQSTINFSAVKGISALKYLICLSGKVREGCLITFKTADMVLARQLKVCFELES